MKGDNCVYNYILFKIWHTYRGVTDGVERGDDHKCCVGSVTKKLVLNLYVVHGAVFIELL